MTSLRDRFFPLLLPGRRRGRGRTYHRWEALTPSRIISLYHQGGAMAVAEFYGVSRRQADRYVARVRAMTAAAAPTSPRAVTADAYARVMSPEDPDPNPDAPPEPD